MPVKALILRTQKYFMQFALYNGLRTEAFPQGKGICLHCGNTVIAKCGSKNVNHWAHVSIACCDAWYESETQWHRDWKGLFGAGRSEVRISKENVFHIADVLNKDDIVFEFQNSSISSETIEAREAFYGERMLWIVNGQHFKDNLIIREEEYLKNWKFTLVDEFAATNYAELQQAII